MQEVVCNKHWLLLRAVKPMALLSFDSYNIRTLDLMLGTYSVKCRERKSERCCLVDGEANYDFSDVCQQNIKKGLYFLEGFLRGEIIVKGI
jgi:hypothetical protein